jgi:hypothetical protein
MTGTVVARLLSINVGLYNDIAWHGETVHTAVWKRTVAGRRMARQLNLEGDGQGDAAPGTVLICCSQPRSDVVIDL